MPLVQDILPVCNDLTRQDRLEQGFLTAAEQSIDTPAIVGKASSVSDAKDLRYVASNEIVFHSSSKAQQNRIAL